MSCQTSSLYSYTARPLSLLFIVIEILKIEHNYSLGSFLLSRSPAIPSVVLPLCSSTAHPLPPFFIVIEILKSNMIIIVFFLLFRSSEPLKIGPCSFQSLLSCWVSFFIIFRSTFKQCYYAILRPVRRLLFIIIVILKIEHNYCWNSFFIFQKSRQPSAALLLLFIVIEILKIKYDYQWGLFFLLSRSPGNRLACFLHGMSVVPPFNRYQDSIWCFINNFYMLYQPPPLYSIIGLLLNLSRHVFQMVFSFNSLYFYHKFQLFINCIPN